MVMATTKQVIKYHRKQKNKNKINRNINLVRQTYINIDTPLIEAADDEVLRPSVVDLLLLHLLVF